MEDEHVVECGCSYTVTAQVIVEQIEQDSNAINTEMKATTCPDVIPNTNVNSDIATFVNNGDDDKPVSLCTASPGSVDLFPSSDSSNSIDYGLSTETEENEVRNDYYDGTVVISSAVPTIMSWKYRTAKERNSKDGKNASTVVKEFLYMKDKEIALEGSVKDLEEFIIAGEEVITPEGNNSLELAKAYEHLAVFETQHSKAKTKADAYKKLLSTEDQITANIFLEM